VMTMRERESGWDTATLPPSDCDDVQECGQGRALDTTAGDFRVAEGRDEARPISVGRRGLAR
jgi:hypothetical protein